MRRLSLKTPPAGRALDWDTVRGHLRLDSVDEQARVMGVLVTAAEEWAESATGRQLITATWTLSLCDFPDDSDDPIVLPKAPLQSVTSVKYYDGDGVQQTWASSNYDVIAPAGPKCAPGFIVPKPGAFYPTTYGEPREIEVEFVAGYGDAPEDVPAGLRAGLLLLVGDMFQHRESGVIGTIVAEAPLPARSLILPYLSEHP